MGEDHNPGIMNMILLTEPVSISKGNFEKTAKAIGFDGLKFVTEDDDEEAGVLYLNDMPFMLISLAFPAPEDTFAGAFDSSIGVDDGKAVIKQHAAHIIVSPMTKPLNMGESIKSAIGLTQLSALISKMGETVGHYWSSAEVLVTHETFVRRFNKMDEGLAGVVGETHNSGEFLPLPMWLGISLTGAESSRNLGAVTRGLNFFTSYELEIAQAGYPQRLAVQRLFEFTKYLFNNGPVFHIGETAKISDKEIYDITAPRSSEQQPERILMTLRNEEG